MNDTMVNGDVENYAASKKSNSTHHNHHHHRHRLRRHHHHHHRPLLIPYMPKRIIVYNFLRRPNNFHAIMYHVSLIVLIIISLFCFALDTVPGNYFIIGYEY